MQRQTDMENKSKLETQSEMNNGPAAAAFLAAGIGSLALGIITTLSEASTPISNALNLYKPVGPLSGKILFEVVVWIIAWVVLHVALKDKQVDFGPVLTVSLILIALGFLGTFPIFFGLFVSS